MARYPGGKSRARLLGFASVAALPITRDAIFSAGVEPAVSVDLKLSDAGGLPVTPDLKFSSVDELRVNVDLIFSAVGERPVADDGKFSTVVELPVIVDLICSAAASAKVTAASPLITDDFRRFLAACAVSLDRPRLATPWQRRSSGLSLCAVVPAPDPAAVAAPSRAVVDAALKKVNWGAVYPRVLAFAISRTKSKARAEDATQDAIRAVYDHELRAWNPQVAPDIVPVLFGIVRRDLGNERGSARVHHEITVISKAHDVRVTRAVSQVASSAPSAESALATRELLSRRLARVRERAAVDPLVLSLLDSVENGVDTAAEQVTALGVPLEDIRRARRRFFDHVAAVARELPDDDDDDTDDSEERDE